MSFESKAKDINKIVKELIEKENIGCILILNEKENKGADTSSFFSLNFGTIPALGLLEKAKFTILKNAEFNDNCEHSIKEDLSELSELADVLKKFSDLSIKHGE